MPIAYCLLTIHCSLFTIHCLSQTDSSFKFLDINNVKARINASGNLFWNFKGVSFYEVPKGSGKISNFSETLWIGGKDSNHNLHFAGEYYRQKGHDYAYGPVMDSVNYKSNWKKWRNVWKINKSTIDSFKLFWNQPAYKIPKSISSWPANGNTALGQTPHLAPFYDYNKDGYYNPDKGDYPLIRGDQAIYFVVHDDTVHTESGGKKLGVEIHTMAYAFNNPSDSALNQTIFLNYQIVNRSKNNYDSLYIGIFDDIDIGWAFDDYIGCDTLLNSFYCYNGKTIDGTGQPWAYGAHPPALSVTLLNDNLKGCQFSFNGDTLPLNCYKFMMKIDTGNSYPLTDRRGLGATGPMSLNPTETKCFDIAFVWARNYTDSSPYSSVTLLKQRIVSIQDFYNKNFANNCADISAPSGIPEPSTINEQLSTKIFPNPAQDFINITIENVSHLQNVKHLTAEIYNVLGNKIHSETLKPSNLSADRQDSQTFKLKISNLDDGLYILKLQSKDYTTAKKIIVRHSVN